MKEYLRKNGIKLAAAVLIAALIAALGANALSGRAGFFRNVAGELKKPVQSVVGAVAGWLEDIYGYMYEYDSVVAENEALRVQLAEAEEAARAGAEALEENERLRNLLDFTEKHADLTLESARVVERLPSNWSSTFTISKGENDGLALGDPVITEYGAVAGLITELGGEWATVSTVIDPATSIGAVLSEAGSTGMLIGDSTLMQAGFAKLTYLPDGAAIFVGDTVITSGVGGSLPQGLVLGSIAQVLNEAGGQVEYGVIEPGCDPDSLVQVFVVTDYDVVN